MEALKEKEKEQEKLIGALKGPHYYQVTLTGYGAEVSYAYISKEAFDFWSEHTNRYGDTDAVSYVLGAEDVTPAEINDIEFNDIDAEDIPRNALFMHDDVGSEHEDEAGYPWSEPKDEFDHTWGVTTDSVTNLTIDKVDSDDYQAGHLEDVFDGDFDDFLSKVEDDSNYEVEPWAEEHGFGDKYPEKGKYICQVISSEKGTFFDATFETPTLFDQNKLKFAVAEAPNGEDLIYSVQYNGEDLDNNGGDTNHKGYEVYFYKQEF